MKPAMVFGPRFERDPEIPASLPAYVDQVVDRWPQGTFREIRASGEAEETSYKQLQARSRRFLSALRTRGAKPGDVVVLLLARASDFIAAAWACIHGDFTWIPWSSGKPFEREEVFAAGLRDLTGRVDAPWILACEITARRFEHWPDLLERCSLLVVDSISPTRGVETPLGAFAGQQGGHGEGSCLISTSGTSGRPKLASLPHRVLLNRYARNLKTAQPLKSLFFAPLQTISGLGIVLPSSDFMVYMQPARLATHPHEVFQQIAKLGIQWFGLSSYIAALVADAHENRPQDADLSSLTRLTFGSDYIVHSQVARLVRNLQACNAGALDISYVYGMTECGPICRRTFSSRELADAAPESSRAAEIGDLLDGWQLRIVDEAGDLLEEEQVGHIEVWSEFKLFSGYPFDPAIQASAFRRDGWFRTGDMGLLRHGRLTVTGRESTKLIAGSGNLSLPQIEASICDLPGLHRSMVMAASLRPEGKLSDELVILFVAETGEESLVEALRRQIAHRVARTTNVRVRELMAVSAHDFQYTESGKLQRNRMLERYRLGEWSAAGSEKREAERADLSELELFLLTLWKRLLELEQLPPRDVSFFALGGDSLASAELIFCVESKFGCELPLAEFYRHPTIERLIEILARSTDAARYPDDTPPLEETHDGLKIVHTIESYVGSWQGTRLFAGGLIVGRNATGRKTPLFWVFQSEDEFQALARHLGPDQPVYGSRSLVNIYPVKDYTADRIQAVVDRYLWEILAMPVAHPVLLGGNCQGAIVALALAKTMKRIQKAPALLVLMEWSFSYGPYSDPTLLIHGSESHTAEIYSGDSKSTIDWKGDFPNHTVASTPGGHGGFFEEPHVEPLACLLRQQFDAHASPIIHRPKL